MIWKNFTMFSVHVASLSLSQGVDLTRMRSTPLWERGNMYRKHVIPSRDPGYMYQNERGVWHSTKFLSGIFERIPRPVLLSRRLSLWWGRSDNTVDEKSCSVEPYHAWLVAIGQPLWVCELYFFLKVCRINLVFLSPLHVSNGRIFDSQGPTIYRGVLTSSHLSKDLSQ